MMPKTLDEIEMTVNEMDDTYDANFGEWIRNEENGVIIGHSLQQYIMEYNTSDVIIVLKWIVKDWTLRSIIVLVNKIITNDIIFLMNDPLFRYEYNKKVIILQGLIYTWNSAYCSELLFALTLNFPLYEKVHFIKNVLEGLEKDQSEEIIVYLEDKIGKKKSNEIKMHLIGKENSEIEPDLLNAFKIL
ncbi:hypothetical protein TCON_1814 [Astathelohania contejeani]|uniref:Uncharacterized protein n=1 Tax=Astathelohania contejeani TaxID=164912 RepID=A0ABQ7HXS4_9MICR|nr:hypothetical protein TCON_1814 [Thelohania contejeani]